MTDSGCPPSRAEPAGDSAADSDASSIEDIEGIEEDLAYIDKMNVSYDFSAWDSFRRSLSVEKQRALKRASEGSRRPSHRPVASCYEEEEKEAGVMVPRRQRSDVSRRLTEEGSACEDVEVHHLPRGTITSRWIPKRQSIGSSTRLHEGGSECEDGSSNGAVVQPSEEDNDESWELTDEERADNALWRMRLLEDEVFNEKYVPKEWERKEMEAIVDFLDLKHRPEGPHLEQYPVTQNAINSIFFTQPGEHESILLKRGPVLVDGEERELMLFTNGFLLARVELDALVNLLLDPRTGKHVCERFSEIDADGSGSLDRGEIQHVFRGMGMPLSNAVLDGLMEKFDSDGDGEVSIDEFQSMMAKLQSEDGKRNSAFWRRIGGRLKRTLTRDGGVTRKLDFAFPISDVERIEDEDNFFSEETLKLVDPELAPLSFAVYLEDIPEPLVVMCAKPDQVRAWVEAFNTCVAWACPSIDWGAGDIKKGAQHQLHRSSRDWRSSRIDWGLDDEDAEAARDGLRPLAKDHCKSVRNVHCSTVDWG